MKSLGFFEIPSVAAAVNALDTMCKAADVQFVTWERKLGGRLVTIIVEGEVSAVKAAIEAAKETGYITEEVMPTLQEWRANPSEWRNDLK